MDAALVRLLLDNGAHRSLAIRNLHNKRPIDINPTLDDDIHRMLRVTRSSAARRFNFSFHFSVAFFFLL
jgi:hypothetical protein